MARRRCVDFEDTKAHDRKAGRRGDYVGDSPRMTKYRKRRSNRRERREGKAQTR
ncbi:hypothetical protein [Actinophytocola sp.]|uniref:hypothetical protein n=1 Tax=Actinophytocola sp. TaxID=1872138 RepID=UPI002D803BEC|nr:hypothetical protein [Actinophytocola sp.]HET9144168.1 hypothetical protein [Actinophytocola sp.]